MKLLVTGSLGFVGLNLVEWYQKNAGNARLFLTDLKPIEEGYASLERNGLLEFSQPSYYYANTANFEEISKVISKVKPDVVLNLAGLYNMHADEVPLFEANNYGVANVARASMQAGVHTLLHFGTASNYGHKGSIIAESTRIAPDNAYNASKSVGEVQAFAYRDPMNVVIMRPGKIYGKHNIYHIKNIFGLVRNGLFFDFGNARNSFVHVEDISKATKFLIDNSISKGNEFSGKDLALEDCVFNVADDFPITSLEIVHGLYRLVKQAEVQLAEKTGKKVSFVKNDLLAKLLYENGVGLKVPFPETALHIGAFFNELANKFLGSELIVERDTIKFITSSHHFSNEKVKSLGLELDYPYAIFPADAFERLSSGGLEEGFKEVVEWQAENVWMK